MQTTEEKVDSSKALDVSLVDTKSSGTTLKEQDTNNRLGNDAHVDDADIKPIYDEEPMAESTASGSKLKPRINNQKSRNWPASETSYVTTKTMPIAEHSRNYRKWVPTGKIFTSSTTKVDSESTNGSNEDITNQYECEQNLNVSACTLNLSADTSFLLLKEDQSLVDERPNIS
ncbi:hypothetical protein Tco_0914455 [Tanacetum coccineum]